MFDIHHVGDRYWKGKLPPGLVFYPEDLPDQEPEEETNDPSKWIPIAEAAKILGRSASSAFHQLENKARYTTCCISGRYRVMWHIDDVRAIAQSAPERLETLPPGWCDTETACKITGRARQTLYNKATRGHITTRQVYLPGCKSPRIIFLISSLTPKQ